jgi:two-component system, cell cycle sensor histidine kinase and response regulator CckA
MALKTVKVPAAMEAPFVAAEAVVAAYFRDRKELPEHGTIEISGERYLLVRAASLSVEFFSLVEGLYGPDREREAEEFSRNILFDLAHAIGKSDAHAFHAKMGLVDPVARLSAGPVHFAFTGWAFVDILPESKPQPNDDCYLLYDHPYSFESDAWLSVGKRHGFAVCIMNAGYSSGWCEESFGITLVAAEVSCRAAGDEHCRFVMAHPDKIEQHVERLVTALPGKVAPKAKYRVPDFFSRKRMEEELRKARDELELRVNERTRELSEANERLVHEMAERKRVEEQLVQTRKLEAVGRLAGGIAHDFNNIMAVVLGSTGLLMHRLPPEDPSRSIVEEIRAAGAHAAALTRQLLAFSRGQSPAREVLQINTVIADLGRMLKPLIGASITLSVTLDPSLGVVELDRGQLEQVIVNLVVNGRDAMPEGGALAIVTANIDVDEALGENLAVVAGKYVCLTVADTGEGMSDDVLAQMYDPFFTTKDASGTGLGLSTVYGIVKQNGGAIAVTTERGRGASFSLYFPRVDGASMSPPSPRSQPDARGAETLLLVEADEPARRALAELLRGFGYLVVETGDPREAIRVANEHERPIDMLLTNAVVPGMSGPDLALRVVSARPRVKVLYLSDLAGGAAPDPPQGDELAWRVRGLLDEPD